MLGVTRGTLIEWIPAHGKLEWLRTQRWLYRAKVVIQVARGKTCSVFICVSAVS